MAGKIFSCGDETLGSRVDSDERLGDLDGVGRRALEQVVCYAPVLDHTPLHAHPPDVGSFLSGDLERRREVGWILGEPDAGRGPQRLEHLRKLYLTLRFDVDALGVAGVDWNPDGGGEDRKAGQREDLAGLLPHLGLFVRVAVVADAPDLGYGVPHDGPGKSVLPTILQRLDAATSGAGDRLIRGDYNLLQAELAGERRQRNDHLGGGAVGVGDKSFVVIQRTHVHLGNDQGHIRVEPEIAAVVDDDGPARDGLLGQLDGSPLLTLRTGEESNVHALEGLRFGHPDLECLSSEYGRTGTPGQNP